MRPTRRVVDQTTKTVIAQARADLARHYRNDREFRKQVARAQGHLRESESLLRKIDAALAATASPRARG